MPNGKPSVFISYSRQDEPNQPRGDQDLWLSFVLKFLRPGETAGIFELWVDQLMMGGDDWESKIEEMLRECDIFMLLVSTASSRSSATD
jgi:hypothetical protein